MLSPNTWHLIDVAFCVVGIVSGLGGGVGFHVIYTNDAAALWASVSGLLAIVCLVQELSRYHSLLHMIGSRHTLLLALLVAIAGFWTSIILFALHIGIAVINQEPFPSSQVFILHSDYIIAVWTLLTAKWSFKLGYSSIQCHKQLMASGSTPGLVRCSSTDFATNEDDGSVEAGAADGWGARGALPTVNTGDRAPLIISEGVMAVTETDFEDESVADMDVTAADLFSSDGSTVTAGGRRLLPSRLVTT